MQLLRNLATALVVSKLNRLAGAHIHVAVSLGPLSMEWHRATQADRLDGHHSQANSTVNKPIPDLNGRSLPVVLIEPSGESTMLIPLSRICLTYSVLGMYGSDRDRLKPVKSNRITSARISAGLESWLRLPLRCRLTRRPLRQGIELFGISGPAALCN